MKMWPRHSTSQVCAKTFMKNGVGGGLVGPELRQGGDLEENWVVFGVRGVLGVIFRGNQDFGGDIPPKHPGSFGGDPTSGFLWWDPKFGFLLETRNPGPFPGFLGSKSWFLLWDPKSGFLLGLGSRDPKSRSLLKLSPKRA